MPIYAYRCAACGHAKDVLQKVSDPLLTVCPACGADSFQKQVTAAGFQLKGSGWYVTDFRDGAKSGDKPTGVPAPSQTDTASAKSEPASPAPAAAPAAATPASTPSASASGASAAPAAGSN